VEKLSGYVVFTLFISLAILVLSYIVNVNRLWGFLAKNNVDKMKNIFGTSDLSFVLLPTSKSIEYIFTVSEDDCEEEKKIKFWVSISIKGIGVALLVLLVFLLVFSSFT